MNTFSALDTKELKMLEQRKKQKSIVDKLIEEFKEIQDVFAENGHS
jgi:hypothetical protein